MSNKESQFQILKRRSLRDGYGNRRVIKCRHCQRKIFDADPGNGAGFRYAHIMAAGAITEHLRICQSGT